MLRFVVFTALAQVAFTGKRRVINKNTGILMGEIDEYPEKLQSRRIQNSELDHERAKVDPDSVYDLDLGVSDWGPFQTTMLMKSYPKGFENPSGFCSLVDEHLTYYVKSVQNVTRVDEIYDHCIFENKIFILTSEGEIEGYSVEVDVDNNPTFLPMYDNAQDSPLNVTFNKFNKEFSEAFIAYHRDSNKIYIPTDICLIILDARTGASEIVSESIYRPNANLVHADIIQGYLFVAYSSEGIFVYNVEDSENVKYVGTIGKEYWGLGAGQTLKLNDFDLHDYEIEFVDTLPKRLDQMENPGTFFNVNFTNRQRNDVIKKPILERNVMMVAERSGVYTIDLEPLFETGQLPTEFHKHYIAVVEPVKITRFHDMIYLLIQDDVSEFPGTVIEIFITEGNFEKWDDINTSEELFRVNRFFYGDELMNIFVDEDFLYVSGFMEHYFYERGINSTYLKQSSSISNFLSASEIRGFEKMIINGVDYLLMIEDTQITLDKVRLRSLRLRCPNKLEQADFKGEFEFQINVTTRNCPRKIEMGLSQDEKFSRVCYFTKDVTIVSNQDMIRTKKDVGLLALFAAVLFCCVFIIVLCCACQKLNDDYKSLEMRYDALRGTGNTDFGDSNVNSGDGSVNSGNEKEGQKLDVQRFGFGLEKSSQEDSMDDQ